MQGTTGVLGWLVLALASVAACDRQKGYVHSPKDFTTLDRKAVVVELRELRRMP